MTDDSILSRLSAFIDKESPKLMKVLQRTWGDQQTAITYKELREAIDTGELSIEYLEQWRQDYSYFVSTYYKPIARKAIEESASSLLANYGGLLHDPQIRAMERIIDKFVSSRGETLARGFSQTQYKAINTLVKQAALTDTMTVDQLAHAIRPCIGLTERQTITTKNYYDQRYEAYKKQYIESGMSKKAAETKAAKEATARQATYADRMHRRRAASIAQTEMAYAYNSGADAVIRESIATGLIADTAQKRWLTADDERVCDICGGLEGETVALDENFSNGVEMPPAHPNCRCAIAYDLPIPDANSPLTSAGISLIAQEA